MQSHRGQKHPAQLPPLDPLAYLSKPSYLNPLSSTQLHYNNVMAQNRQLREDNQILLLKLQKYQKLQPYIDGLIHKNSQLQSQMQNLANQNMYLMKSIRQQHVQAKNTQTTHLSKTKQLQQLIQVGKQNGNRIRLQNQSLHNKIKLHLSQIQQYKHKLQQCLTQKIHQQSYTKQLTSERDKLLGQIKQIQNYNKELVRNGKLKEDQLMEKIEAKEKSIKMLEKELQECRYVIEKMEEEKVKREYQMGEMANNMAVLQRNHQAALEDIRGLGRRKVELETLYEQCMEKVAVREEQLRQIQMFRQQQRNIYNQQFTKLQQVFQAQKQEYKQALSHKILKIQQLTQSYNTLLLQLDQYQKQLYQLSQSHTTKCQQQKHKQQCLQQSHKQIQQLYKQLQSKCIREQQILAQMYQYEQEIRALHEGIDTIQRRYQEREGEFQAYVRNVRGKYEMERSKWEGLYQEEKNKMKSMHQYEKRQIQSMWHKKVIVLQAEIQDYRHRLGRAQTNKIDKNQKEIFMGKTVLAQNTNANKQWLERSFEKLQRERERERQREREREKERERERERERRDSVDKKQKQNQRNPSQFNTASGSKTARQPGYK